MLQTSLWQRMSAEFHRRNAQATYAAAKGALERQAWTVQGVLTVGLALAVYAVCVLSAVWLVWAVAHHALLHGFFAFIACGVIGIALSRMVWRRPKTLKRAEHPALYALLDEVRGKLGHRSAIDLCVTSDFNAFYTRDWLGQPIIGLGLPLMHVLSAQERVSLLAHEVAHGVNRDILRLWLLHFPMALLHAWTEVLLPDALMNARAGWGGRSGLVQSLGNFGMRLLALVPLNLLRLFHLLTMHQSQLSEYRADLLEARVSGKAAAISSMDKLHFAPTYISSLHKQTLAPERPHLYAEFAHQMARRSPEAVAKVREEYRARHTALESHPPTVLRMRFLEETAPDVGALELSEARNAEISRELECFIPACQREAIEHYRVAMLL